MTYLLPVVAIVLGVLVLSESITVLVLVGIALVLAGVGADTSPSLTARGQPPRFSIDPLTGT